jgi:hypothetical protein
MNNVQSMLSLGALVILSMVSMNFHSSVLETSTVEIENKVALTAFSLADDLIEEIKVRAFDEKTIEFPTTNPMGLTPPGSLGPEAGEVYGTFNDVDDYHGLIKNISAPHAENYRVECIVQYVQEDNFGVVSTVQTFYKRVTVNVSSPYLRHPVSLSFIFTLK